MAGIDFDTRLTRVAGSSAPGLEKHLGYRTVGDLLRHVPRKYLDLSRPGSFSELDEGQTVAFVATVQSVRRIPFRNNPRKYRVVVQLSDDSGATMEAVFFNQPSILKTRQGSRQLLQGEVSRYQGQLQLASPKMVSMPGGKTLEDMGRTGLWPIYPASEKVDTWKLADTIRLVLDVVDAFPEPIPDTVRRERDLVDAATAYERIHRPRTRGDWTAAQRRFRFEEAFEIQAVLARRRLDSESEPAVARLGVPDGIRHAFGRRLPFTLTEGQRRVIEEITADLARPHPMHRLLQGEVGSGKTVVALEAMLQVVDSGAQAALLAPTEVLAVQHHRGIERLLGDLAAGGMLGGAEHATRVRLLTGSMGAKARQAALLDIVSGEAGIVVGTHALLEESVRFADLGLVVIDEQHRFGVEQRAALTDRGAVRPHVLVMTATPIPRTVAMTVFGDLEVSTLRELPAGRQAIQTTVVPVAEQPGWLDRAWERIVEEVRSGRQAYVVVARIGDADADADAAPPDDDEEERRPPVALVDLADQLQAGPLAQVEVGRLHGRMTADEKDATMAAFAAGQIDVLVATTVIEVGVDVPNATTMVVMDADRFGVSQLHQLRGRVGRGGHAGLCLLVTGAPAGSLARTRLDAVAATTDGFSLAQLDVELRREGDVLGTRQSGLRSSLRLLSVVRDEAVIADAREAAMQVMHSGDVPADLEASIHRLEQSEQSEYLERT